jgi:hypothetical protein
MRRFSLTSFRRFCQEGILGFPPGSTVGCREGVRNGDASSLLGRPGCEALEQVKTDVFKNNLTFVRKLKNNVGSKLRSVAHSSELVELQTSNLQFSSPPFFCTPRVFPEREFRGIPLPARLEEREEVNFFIVNREGSSLWTVPGTSDSDRGFIENRLLSLFSPSVLPFVSRGWEQARTHLLINVKIFTHLLSTVLPGRDLRIPSREHRCLDWKGGEQVQLGIPT